LVVEIEGEFTYLSTSQWLVGVVLLHNYAVVGTSKSTCGRDVDHTKRKNVNNNNGKNNNTSTSMVITPSSKYFHKLTNLGSTK